MNSEISNVLKLSPVTVVKADHSANERLLSGVREDAGTPSSVSSLSGDASPNGLSKDESEKTDRPTLDAVKKAADQGNSLLQAVNRNLQFKVDDSTKELVVKIVDSESGELVRQIPSEEMLAFIKRMQELDGQQGSMIQDRA